MKFSFSQKKLLPKTLTDNSFEIFLKYGTGLDDLHLMILSTIFPWNSFIFLLLKEFFCFGFIPFSFKGEPSTSHAMNHIEIFSFQKPLSHLGSNQRSNSSSFHLLHIFILFKSFPNIFSVKFWTLCDLQRRY